ncbi:AAA family ATPase [Elongatibacter sediminis]|uniref:AAA family ATPase n=1 Tax=Elongatibacter sediminis TaxID=3119006 RepID=A0AAW9RD49_9GAMM
MKTIVVNSRDQTRVPFLRGILIRTLLDAGMPFDDAFDMADRLRDHLSETDEIYTHELRELVHAELESYGDPSVFREFSAPLTAPSKIRVRCHAGTVTAFSRGRHQRYLQSSGVRLADAEPITTRIFDQLLAAGAVEISTAELGYLTWLCLRQELGEGPARQYLLWSEFQLSARPMVLLICGAVGSGKSSIATEIAHRLEIVRTQSTDMLREVMRTMMPKKLLPILHCSSFDAWKTLPLQDKKSRPRDLLIADGYQGQAELLAVPCEAVVKRAMRENVPLILEGVHAHPDLLERFSTHSDAIVVHVTLAVMQADELKSRLRGRGTEEPHRHARRYLKKFDSIWSLQSFLLAEAERCDTPIIPNDDKEAAIFQIISTINAALSDHFSGSPADVFGPVVRRLGSQAEDKAWQLLVPALVNAVDGSVADDSGKPRRGIG